MDFHHPSLEQEMRATNDYVFDEFEYEDDGFYCELRRQVMQLTAEDDDVDEECYENKKQGLNNGHCSSVSHERSYYNWPTNKEDDLAAPTWILNLWRTGNNGTGEGRQAKEEEHTSKSKKI
ncbi:hypothetical protein DH2020_032180 [Rehmannia glutinosa]|uniref:Uncharacterized protein n=1 Tax=Rehmannia glutinosa TaxID=99300 RepID=A0ABR0VG10_REHGL